MQCRNPIHDWEMSLGRKALKQSTPGTPSNHVERWFEVVAPRKCRACGWENARTKVSAKWDDQMREDAVQKLESSFQNQLDNFKMALNGDVQIDPQLQALRELIRGTYQDIWLTWFVSTEFYTNATLLVWESGNSTGYHWDLDAMEITIQNGTPDEPGALKPETWPSWKSELVHEMLHELEAKTPFAPSEAGIRLFRNSIKRFPNHPPEDLRFFTAIVDKAESVRLTPERFLELL